MEVHECIHHVIKRFRHYFTKKYWCFSDRTHFHVCISMNGLLKLKIQWMVWDLLLFSCLILSISGQKWYMSFFRVPHFTLQFNLADNDLLSKCKYVEPVLALTQKVFSHFSSYFKIPLLAHKSCRCKAVCLYSAQTQDEGDMELYIQCNSLANLTL